MSVPSAMFPAAYPVRLGESLACAEAAQASAPARRRRCGSAVVCCQARDERGPSDVYRVASPVGSSPASDGLRDPVPRDGAVPHSPSDFGLRDSAVRRAFPEWV